MIAAAANGFAFISRSNQEVLIQVNGEYEEYELLEVIEFDSTRKRMSIIVRCPNGQLRLFAKGADSVIFERLAIDQDPRTTALHLHEFAVEGLRKAVPCVQGFRRCVLREVEASLHEGVVAHRRPLGGGCFGRHCRSLLRERDCRRGRRRESRDDYRAIMVEGLADRLAEAVSGALHEDVRLDIWGYMQGEEKLSKEDLI